ncbi:GNAT family N-acetyltransferase [Intrasporangium sp. YIM S08009]|uniref:GNAT family N-acetyltransferase n=1 Tax=Intrasporangium zincisolvens TaxID=3080018 RepID=UPI002B05D56F|nr:GNAT family N-acetyltransferase [Intrasporangium sp. YIM S08009]
MPVLRDLTLGDLDDLLVVQREGAVAGMGHFFPQETYPFPTERIRERWAREVEGPDVECFAVVEDGRLRGFAALRGAELLHFGTAVDTWGTGLAGRAHDELLDRLRAAGHAEASLRVFDENARAVRFYARRGWVATDVTSRSSFAPFPVLRRLERRLDDA